MIVRAHEVERIENCYLIRFQFYKMQKVLVIDGGDVVQCCEGIFEMVNMVNFMCILP